MGNGKSNAIVAPTQVVFRVDASRIIGTGHVIRCLTLADTLAAAGCRCRFVTRAHDGHLAEVIRTRGHDVAILSRTADRPPFGDLAHSAWLGIDQQTDAAETAASFAGDAPEWIVVDHYALDCRWESTLRSHCRRIMAIDDLADRVHDCDLLLDQNVAANAECRYDGLVPTSCGRLIGPRFALLQPVYADLHASAAPRTGPIRRILVYFGGGDVAGITEKTLAGISPLLDGSFRVDLVMNATLPQASATRGLVAGLHGVTVHKSLPSLAPLIASADLSIGAGGATSLERCCLGLPSIVVTLAENQRQSAAELHRRGLVEWLGDQAEVDSKRIGSAVAAALERGSWEDMSRRCLELLDGRGTSMVAGFLLLGPSTPLRARRATAADEALLLEWANDPAVRVNSFNTARIDAESHHDWFRRKLDAGENCPFFIVEAYGWLPIGQVRFDRTDDGWLINYSLDSRARSRGLGGRCLETAMHACPAGGEMRFIAMVKPANSASTRVFNQLGFALISSDPQLTFVKEIPGGM